MSTSTTKSSKKKERKDKMNGFPVFTPAAAKSSKRWADMSSDSEVDYSQNLDWQHYAKYDLPDFLSIHKSIQNNIGGFVFRRTQQVFLRKEDLRSQRLCHPDLRGYDNSGVPKFAMILEPNYASLSGDDIEKRAEFRYATFQGNTLKGSIREEADPCPGISIEFRAENKCRLAIEDGSFTLVPLVHENAFAGYIPPRTHSREADIICGCVAKVDGKWRYTKWFIASEQFLRTWTLLMFGTKHKAFDTYRKSKDNTEERLRTTLMAKNTLCGNSYRKMLMACEQNGVAVTGENRHARFYLLRSELGHCPHVHLYAAVVTMCIYNELPASANVPKTLGNEPKMLKWDLPENFVEKVCGAHESKWPSLAEATNKMTINQQAKSFVVNVK